MNQNVPLQRLKEFYRELESATDITSSFDFTDRDATKRLAEVETAIQTFNAGLRNTGAGKTARRAISKI